MSACCICQGQVCFCGMSNGCRLGTFTVRASVLRLWVTFPHLSCAASGPSYVPSGVACTGRENCCIFIRLRRGCAIESQHGQLIPMVLCSVNVKEALETDPEAYYTGDEMLQPLMMMYNSLHATHDDSIGNGRLLDVIRQVSPLFTSCSCHTWLFSELGANTVCPKAFCCPKSSQACYSGSARQS